MRDPDVDESLFFSMSTVGSNIANNAMTMVDKEGEGDRLAHVRELAVGVS